MRSPLEQFQVNVLLIWNLKTDLINIILANFTFILILILVLIFWMGVFVLSFSFIVPNVRNFIIEKIYGVLLDMMTQITSVVALQYYPYIASVFVIILFSNVLGLVPYAFTLTSQLLITFILSISTFVGVTSIGIWKNKFNLIKFFIPSAIENIGLKMFLVIIEVLSYIIRPFSLGIRLFANMLAGHTLMYILGTFMYAVSNKNIILLLVLPLVIVMLVVVLEICIAFIQTYVFTILVIIYINDMFNINH